MKAMILAAGLGTRLKDLTGNLPKALVPVNGKPMLEWLLMKLKNSGIEDIIINVHHFPELIIDFLSQNQHFGMNISISDECDKLLDTGGGLLKASWFFENGDDFLLHNVDVISDVDFKEMLSVHQKNKASATLAVTKRKSSRQLLFSEGRMTGWENTVTQERIIKIETDRADSRAFSGIHVISPEIFNMINLQGKFSMIDVYLDLCSDHFIGEYQHNDENWLDLGKPEALPKAEILVKELFKK